MVCGKKWEGKGWGGGVGGEGEGKEKKKGERGMGCHLGVEGKGGVRNLKWAKMDFFPLSRG